MVEQYFGDHDNYYSIVLDGKEQYFGDNNGGGSGSQLITEHTTPIVPPEPNS